MSQHHEQLLNDWRDSGLSQKAFCREKGIKFGKLFYARQKELASIKNSSQFLKVKVQVEQNDKIPLTIVFPSGARLELASFTTTQLKQLLQ